MTSYQKTIKAGKGSLTTAQIRAIKEEVTRQHCLKKEQQQKQQAKSKSDGIHEYWVQAIANYKAPTKYPPTTTAVTFDQKLPAATQTSKCGKNCKLFLRNVHNVMRS